jgi:acetoin utilization protein AcuB
MTAVELISDIIVPLRTSDAVGTAFSLMAELKVSHLPVVNNLSYLALLSESDLEAGIKDKTPVGDVKLTLSRPMVSGNQHIYDVIRMMSEHKLSVLPVVDDDENYLGAVSLQSLTAGLAGMSAVFQPGTVVILEMSQNNYSLSQIAQIVESNDARVLSLYLSPQSDSTMLEVILKVNKTDVTNIISTFNRYDYIIKASYGEDTDPADLKDRYDSLMNYLNV